MSTIQTYHPIHYQSKNEAVIELSGDLTYRYAERIEADFLSLICNGVSLLNLDFSEVNYMNSTGIALLIRLINLCRSKDVEIKASGLSPHYHEIFKITRLGDYIKVIP